ncbi:MAG: zinc-dependent dehydrogenase [Candidatus Bathyarchaeaceae archaeon]
MKAAVYYSLDDIRVEETPKPKIGPDEILVEMKACGICGSDLMEWYLKNRAPLVIGHEPSGIIVEVGNKVEDFKVGERVFVHHHVACLTCHYCLRGDYTMCEKFRQTHIQPGGFAEYFRVPAPNLQIDTLKIPDNISFEEATLIEPFACCVRALTKCKVQPGDTVVIIGAGPSGIIHVMLSRNLGASQIIVSDLVKYRLEAAKRFGADLAINPRSESLAEKVRETTDGRGADMVVVTAPDVEALLEGMNVCRKGGTLCVFAPTSPNEYMRVSSHRLFFSEIKLIPSYSTSHVETRTALKLISSGRIRAKELITHRFPLSRIGDAFKTAAKGNECLKVVVLNE